MNQVGCEKHLKAQILYQGCYVVLLGSQELSSGFSFIQYILCSPRMLV